jgi:hypothetical protein
MRLRHRASRKHKRVARRRRSATRRQRGGVAAPELKYEHPGAEIKMFTSSDRMEPTLEALLASTKRHNYSYEVIGFGKPWKGFKTKMENYLEGINRYVKEKGPSALAIFVDAFDVICIKDAAKQLASYKAKPRGMPVSVGVEIICFYEDNCSMEALKWYDDNKIPGGSAQIKAALFKPEPHRPYYESPTSVFLNSGFIMGTASELQAMFQSMMDSGDTDDQIAVINYMLKAPGKVDYDVEESLIRNKLKPRTRLPDEDGEKGPGFLHFPGTRTKEEQAKNVAEYYRQYS